jgi:hypothetical protein
MHKREASFLRKKLDLTHRKADLSFTIIWGEIPVHREPLQTFTHFSASILFIIALTMFSGTKDWEEMTQM